jgi:hypothetical protein
MSKITSTTTTHDQLHVPAGAIRVDDWEGEKVVAKLHNTHHGSNNFPHR